MIFFGSVHQYIETKTILHHNNNNTMDTEPPLSLGGGGDGSQPGTGPSSVASSRSGYTTHNMLLLQNEQAVVRKAGRYAIRQFLDSHTCFAVLRTSGKVVVFDTRIPIQLAFYALVEHGTYILFL